MIGYPNDIVTYERAERFAGESKYPLSKMLAFAFEGITSLSVKLIRFITIGGALYIKEKVRNTYLKILLNSKKMVLQFSKSQGS